MPLQIVTEQYNTLNSLYANGGDWVDGESLFTTRFQAGSGTSNKITYYTQGSNHWLQFDYGSWADAGFLQGDIITITATVYANGQSSQAQSWVSTITYINGNELYLNAPLGAYIGGFGTPGNGTTFPLDGILSGMSVVTDKLPNALEFYFNLTPNGTVSLNSLIDSEVNRFELQDVDAMTIGNILPMTQLGNKSGGLIKDVNITYLANNTGGYNDFKVTYKFLQYVIIQDGFIIPAVYENAGHVAPIINIKGFAQYGNPNGVLQDTTTNLEANTGEYNENYNGAPNNYSVQSIVWNNVLGDVIEALDYSATSSFTAVINAPNQINPTSIYNIGLVWRPIDAEFYQNRLPSLGNNLLINAPEVDFNADGVIDPTVYAGLPYIGNQSGVSSDGAQWDLQNIKFELTVANELTVKGDVIPNANASAMFSQIQDDGRKSTLWISIANVALTGFSVDRVSLTLFDQDNIDAPVIGVQIPDIVDQYLYDHNLNDITASADPNTTTEDDVLYESNFRLIDNIDYEGIRARIFAYNTVTEQEFTLENNFFSFSNVVNISGQFQPNFSISRGFNLPPTSDRNVIELVRNTANDIAGKYGVKLRYGFLNDWRYWLEQSNVSNDFFDILQSFNGDNKNWQVYGSGLGDWILRLSYYTTVNGVDDFNHQAIKIRPYEDNGNITTTRQFTVLSDLTTPTNLPENELVEVEYVLTWSTANYSDEWAEVTIEDYEAGNRWVISSVLPQGNINANPLKPISGNTFLDLVISPANVATVKCLIDTSLINVNNVSLSVRIFSTPIIVEGKRTTFGVLKRTAFQKGQTPPTIIKQKAGVSPTPPTDPDADAFILATGITDATQKSAINTLVVDLKGYSLWSKMDALYPFVGGTSTTHKYNLKNPLDTDVANRIVWSGGITHDANGITGNGVNAYGDTFLNDSTDLSINDKHISIYQRNILVSPSKSSMGIGNGNRFYLDFSGDNYSTLGMNQSPFSLSINQKGMFIMSKIISGEFKYFQNSLTAVTKTGTNLAQNNNYYVLACNISNSGFDYSLANLSFASLGSGLSATEVTDFRTSIETFQTTLSRNV